MPLKIYQYKACSTCQKAIKFLDSNKIKYQSIAIVEEPPSLPELKTMLKFLKVDGGTFKNLFNTSGVVYREQNISQKIKDGLSEEDALKALNKNGKLIKRPFLLGDKFGTVGFKEDVWKKLFS